MRLPKYFYSSQNNNDKSVCATQIGSSVLRDHLSRDSVKTSLPCPEAASM